jgi:amidase
MSHEQKITVAESGAFIHLMKLEPTGSGLLDGLSFGVKDLIDIQGYVTGCGNPDWARQHPPAPANAVCVDQMLASGASCIGKTVSDELAFSLDGENVFYGTPLNPRAPDRVPGGSSSGSASAVACGLVDFALGTDTGGSVRVPAGNCGVFGLRPSHGLVSVAGILPFAPSFDTVGILAKNVDILARVAVSLLSCEVPTSASVDSVYVFREALALCDPEVKQALKQPFQMISDLLGSFVREVSIREIDGEASDAGLTPWLNTFCTLQWADIWSCLGGWIEASKPTLGPRTSKNFELARNLDRRRIGLSVQRKEAYRRRLNTFLKPHDLLCLPTTPALAPVKGTLGDNARTSQAQLSYYPRTLSLTSIAGIGRLPQTTLPLGDVAGVPVGVSLIAGYGQDAFLLKIAELLAGTR